MLVVQLARGVDPVDLKRAMYDSGKLTGGPMSRVPRSKKSFRVSDFVRRGAQNVAFDLTHNIKSMSFCSVHNVRITLRRLSMASRSFMHVVSGIAGLRPRPFD